MYKFTSEFFVFSGLGYVIAHMCIWSTCIHVFYCTSLLTKPTFKWVYYLGVIWGFLAQKGAEQCSFLQDSSLFRALPEGVQITYQHQSLESNVLDA